MTEYKKYSEEELNKFIEDNFLDEGIADSLANFVEGEEVSLEVLPADTADEAELVVRVKLS